MIFSQVLAETRSPKRLPVSQGNFYIIKPLSAPNGRPDEYKTGSDSCKSGSDYSNT